MLSNRKWVYREEADEDGSDNGGTAVVDKVDESSAAAKPADQGAVDDKQQKSDEKGVWPDDWREKIAKGDDKRLGVIKRYTSPEAVADALIAAQNKIRSGELKTSLQKDAKPEEIAQWRKDNGIPETPDKYDLKFDSGLVIGEEDKPIIDGFLQKAHTHNLPPSAVKDTVEWYYQEQERQIAERQAMDAEQKRETQDALNAEWGTEYRQNVDMIEGVLTIFPESVRNMLKGGRLADNTGIFNSPDIMRGFAALALQVNPAATLVPGGSGDPMKGVEGRIEEIENAMKSDRKAYNSNEKLQAEYRDLLTARDKLQERSKQQK